VRLLERGGELSSNLIEWAKLLTEILLGSGFFWFLSIGESGLTRSEVM